MNKIKKFKKSKKTNNKRNHKRRRMTRKLRGGVIPGGVIKQEWPLGTPQPIPSYNEPPQEIQRLEDRIRLLEEIIRSFNFTHLEQEIQRLEERINVIPQTDNTGELREQITALQRKILSQW